MAQDSAIFLAVRPEKLTLSTEKPAPDLNAVRGRITAQTYLGDRRQYLVAASGQPKPVTVSQQISGAASQTPAGDEVWIAWRPELGRVLTE